MKFISLRQRGQITLSSEIREKFSCSVGDTLALSVRSDRIEIFNIEVTELQYDNLSVVRTRYQLTLPEKICRQFHLSEGDFLEPVVEENRLALSPKVRILSGSSEVPQHAQKNKPGFSSNLSKLIKSKMRKKT